METNYTVLGGKLLLLYLILFHSEKIRADEIPSDLREMSEEFRQELIENVANVDEKLGEMFLGKMKV